MLQVRLLGQFDVRVDGKRITIPSRAGQSLLAYLLLTAGTAHRRERLAGLLWPDTSDENARHNLRTDLWRVRKAIGGQRTTGVEYILAEELTVTFNPEADYWLDVAQLERSIPADGALNDLINQLTVYQGELLPGFYDDWIVLERERLQALFENTMKQLMETLIRERRWATVLDWGERWIALGQTPEPAYCALMAAYAAIDDRSKVVATYERCRAALDKELGVEPADETRTLYEQLSKDEDGRIKNESTLLQLSSLSLHPSSFILHPLRHEEPPALGEPPFKGLQYFDESDADLFFGRELLTAQLVGHLRESRFLAVIVGASGSGKSSIVRAGLISALRKGEPLADGTLPPDGSSQWSVHIITPTAHPLEALAIALTHDIESVTATATLMDDLASDPRSLALYIKRAAHIEPALHILLVVDQFEELFTLCRDEFEREAFIDNLLTALTLAPLSHPGSPKGVPREGDGGGGSLTLILTIRADFYAHLAQYPELREAVAKQQEYIGPMTADELRRAIEEPAKQGGWEFEPGVVDLMLRDVGDEPGALPLLSHALLETWKRRSGRTLTLKGYADSGGVRGAIAYTAETVYQELSPEQQVLARNVFLRLTELGEGTEDTRRRAMLSELITQADKVDPVRAVLNTLADARLITLGADTAEVAHEALIREWPRLREWLNEDREGLLLHRHLTEAAHDWEILERDPGALYRGARLAQAGEWASTNEQRVNDLERAFLQTSIEQEQHEAQQHEAQRQRELQAARELAETRRRTNAQLRQRALYLAGAFILAMGLAGVALFFGDQARQSAVTSQANASAAENERRVATARELAASAITNLDVDPERSVLLALQAVSAADAPETEDALHQAMLATRLQLTLAGHQGAVWSVAYSPDGTRLATASQDKTARVWDAATGKLLLTLSGHTDSVNGIAFSPDGQRVATASDDHTAKVWDATTGRELLTFTDHTDHVSRVAFSPDGKRLATTSDDMTAKVWDPSTGKLLVTLHADSQPFFGVAFSPDGSRLAMTELFGPGGVWDASTGRRILTLPNSGQSRSVAFSPDGTRLALTSDQDVKVWDASSGQMLLTLSGHAYTVRTVVFSQDGTRLATVGEDRKAIVWDASSGHQLFTITGHANGIIGAAFSPDGQRLATSSLDFTAKVWDISPAHELLTISAPTITGLKFARIGLSPDGKRVSASLPDHTARVWDTVTGRELLTLRGHADWINEVAYSPDGTRIATGGLDTMAKVWDAASGKELLTLTGNTDAVAGIAFSPDGARIATAGHDQTVRVWDATTGRELLSIPDPFHWFTRVAFSPDGTRLAAAASFMTGLSGGALPGAVGYPKGIGVVWDASTGKQLFTLSGHTLDVYDIAFNRDGTRLATASQDGTAKIWDAATGKELVTLAGHTGIVVRVAFSPDGTHVATAGVDGTAKIWDAVTGKELLTLYGDNVPMDDAVFSPDGTRLIARSDDAVRIYLLRIEDLVALAKTRVTRSLTTEECQKYLHVDECPAR